MIDVKFENKVNLDDGNDNTPNLIKQKSHLDTVALRSKKESKANYDVVL